VVSIDGLLALLAAFRKQTCYFYYFMYIYIFLFVENKFFFFFLYRQRLEVACRLRITVYRLVFCCIVWCATTLWWRK